MVAGSKSIMIFGAGINQIELIREARNLGVKSIVIDVAPEPPGEKLADFFYQVDGKDYETTKTIALRHKINGIVTGQTEKPLKLMAGLAQELNLRFHSPLVVERSLDKWLMKQAFVRDNVPCAKGILINFSTKLEKSLLSDLQFPLIIKPKDATSSQGVFKIDTIEEIKQFIEITRSFSHTGEIMIEEFLKGPEYSIESVTFNGISHIIQFTEKFITPFPATVEMGHLQPAQLTGLERKAIKQLVNKAINAIGIDNSASHAEVKLTAEGPKMIEIGARAGGDFISSYLTHSSTGISIDKASIQIALGLEPDLKITHNRYSYIRYLELPVGRKVNKILPFNDLKKMPGYVFSWIYIKPGEIIKPITHSALRPACIIVENSSRQGVIKLAERNIKELSSRILLN